MPRVSARRNYWSPRKRQEFVQSMGALSTTDPAESSELSDEDGSEEAQSEVESQDAESELPVTAPFSLRRSAALVDPQNGAGTWMHTTMTLFTHWVVQPMLVGASAAFGLSVGYAAFDYVSSFSLGGWFAIRGRSFWARSSPSSGGIR